MEPFPSARAAAEALRLGADPRESCDRLLASLEATEERARRAEAEAAVDVLTGLASRRQWERALEVEEHRSARYGHQACVVAIDLDGLKAINDAEGHVAGDDCLRRAATALAAASRAADVVARVGGDEFALLAVDTDLRTGRVLVARLADALARAGVAASVGLADRDRRSGGGGLAAAWAQADHHMYATKRRRRRRAQLMAPLEARTSTATPRTTR